MLSITQLQPGVIILINNAPYEVLSSNHVQMGRGGGIQRVKLRNLRDGSVVDQTFKGNQTVPEVKLERKSVQYLYTNGPKTIFMDPTTFEQFEKESAAIKGSLKYLKEGDTIDSLWLEGQLLSLQLPIKMTITVTDTEPGLRGDRQTAGTKPATLETGTTIQVPLFIKVGDKIVIDTRTGKYIERDKQKSEAQNSKSEIISEYSKS